MNHPVTLPLCTAAFVLSCTPGSSVDPAPDPARTAATDSPTTASPSASAGPSATSAPTPSGSAATDRNALFLALFRRQLPDDLCKPDQYFRACFRVSEARCKEVVREELDRCVARHAASLPLVRGRDSGAQAGQVLGQCAGAAYDIRLLAERLQSAQCNDPTQWVGK